MLRNPFHKEKDKFKILPHISSNSAKDEVAKRLLKAYIGYWGTFILWLVVSYNFIPMIFLLVALMWCIGGYAAIKLPEESGKIAFKTRHTIVTYIIGLLVFRLILYIILSTPTELWQQVFMTEIPDAIINSFSGFISMSFIIAMFMGFSGYVGYIGQLFLFHRTNKKTSDYITIIMRKEDVNK